MREAGFRRTHQRLVTEHAQRGELDNRLIRHEQARERAVELMARFALAMFRRRHALHELMRLLTDTGELMHLEGLLDLLEQSGRIDRLGQIGSCAQLQRADRGFRGRARGEQDHRKVWIPLADLLEHGDAVDLGHVHIRQHQVERLPAEQLTRVRAVLRHDRLVALARQDTAQQLPHQLIVVDDEQSSTGSRGFRSTGSICVHESSAQFSLPAMPYCLHFL